MTRTKEAPRIATAGLLLAALIAGFIVYGSLYPFRFQALPDGVAWSELFRLSLARRGGRGDVAANLLLYAPLALALALAFVARLGPVRAGVLAVLACALLSTAMEIGQLFVPRRAPSAGDLLLNVAGAIGGAVTAAFVAPRRARGP
ncbi:VanZ family protein, partial [Falsiroseomonas oryzae]|uniref:VanZ family protein n=1 Tax=Falsiroseomonas oryzae TaxID=2766473 RepID=UPI0022EA1C4E